MKRMLAVMIMLLLSITITSCSLVIEDTPELRAAFGESVVPVPELPAEEVCLDILGNVAADGELIYHMQGQANYDRVKPEAYFCTEEEAQAAGYRKSLR